MWKLFNKIIAFIVIFSMILEQSGFAQAIPQIQLPAYISGYVAVDRFRPVQLRSLSFDSANQNFNLFLDKGDESKISQKQISLDAKLLMKYFNIGLALPNDSFWVNLRPDAADQIIDPYLERTDAGQIMLAADLQLKKDLARFTSPNTQEGRQYWNKLYAKAETLFGDQDISIPTVTRPWIVPGEIMLSETNSACHILKASLNVCLEQDYLKDSPSLNFQDPRLKELNDYSSQLIRELVMPKLTREVNSSKKYAPLRQVYYSLVLAQWFKQKYQGSQGEYAQKINSRDLNGLTSAKPWDKAKYFSAYKRSFQQGEYNLSENTVSASGMTVRQYFSGGERFVVTSDMINIVSTNSGLEAQLPGNLDSELIRVLPDGRVIVPKIEAQQQIAGMPKKDGGSEELTFLEKLLRPVLVLLYIEQLKKGASSGEAAATQLGRLGAKRSIKVLEALEAYIIMNLESARDPLSRNLLAEQSLRQLDFEDTDIERIYLEQLDHEKLSVQIRAAERLGEIGGYKSRQALDIKAAAPDIETYDMGIHVKRAFTAASEEIKSRGQVSTKSKDGGSEAIGYPAVHKLVFDEIVKRHGNEADIVRLTQINDLSIDEINALAWAMMDGTREIQESIKRLDVNNRLTLILQLKVIERMGFVATKRILDPSNRIYARQSISSLDGGSEHRGMDLQDTESISILTAKLKSASPSVRELASRELGNRNAIIALPELKEALNAETVWNVRNTIAYALAKINKNDLRDISEDMSQSPEVRDSAQRALSDLKRNRSAGNNRSRRDEGSSADRATLKKVSWASTRIIWGFSSVEKVVKEGWAYWELDLLVQNLHSRFNMVKLAYGILIGISVIILSAAYMSMYPVGALINIATAGYIVGSIGTFMYALVGAKQIFRVDDAIDYLYEIKDNNVPNRDGGSAQAKDGATKVSLAQRIAIPGVLLVAAGLGLEMLTLATLLIPVAIPLDYLVGGIVLGVSLTGAGVLFIGEAVKTDRDAQARSKAGSLQPGKFKKLIMDPLDASFDKAMTKLYKLYLKKQAGAKKDSATQTQPEAKKDGGTQGTEENAASFNKQVDDFLEYIKHVNVMPDEAVIRKELADRGLLSELALLAVKDALEEEVNLAQDSRNLAAAILVVDGIAIYTIPVLIILGAPIFIGSAYSAFKSNQKVNKLHNYKLNAALAFKNKIDPSTQVQDIQPSMIYINDLLSKAQKERSELEKEPGAIQAKLEKKIQAELERYKDMPELYQEVLKKQQEMLENHKKLIKKYQEMFDQNKKNDVVALVERSGYLASETNTKINSQGGRFVARELQPEVITGQIIPYLEGKAKSGNPYIQEVIVEALPQIRNMAQDGGSIVAQAVDLARSSYAPTTEQMIVRSVEKLTHPDPRVRGDAAEALARLNKLTKELKIIRYVADLSDPASYVRFAAAKALGEIGDPQTIEPLVLALKDDYVNVRLAAVEALGNIGDPRAVEPLQIALARFDPLDQNAVATALRKIIRKSIERDIKDGGSEPVTVPAPEKTGGVDFRALPVTVGIVPVVAAGANAAMPQVSLKELDSQWKEILRTAQKGELPYEQMKQLVSCCKAKEEAAGLKQEVTAYVVNLLKCEEERAISTPAQLKEIVALVAA